MRTPSPPRGFRGPFVAAEAGAELANRISGPFRHAPLAWAEPVDLEDLVRLVRYAAHEGLPLIPRGGGTGMPGGNLGAGIVVSMGPGFRTFRIEASEGEVHLRAGAGVTAETLDEVAAGHGRFFPPLPSSAAWATVGGMVANNAAGARSFGYGAIADHVVSVTGVDAEGRIVTLGPKGEGEALPETWGTALAPHLSEGLPRGWPRLRKNSSGYGLDRFLRTGNPAQLAVGSEGTLLFITSTTFRLAPRRAPRGVVLLPVAGPDEVGTLALLAGEWGASACEFLGQRLLQMARLDEDPEIGPLARGAFALLLLEFESTDGTSASLEARMQAPGAEGARRILTTDPERADRLWALRKRASPLIASRAGEGFISTQFIEDSVVPPEALGSYLVGLEQVLRDAGEDMDAVVFGHAGDGNVHVNPLVPVRDPAWPARVRAVLEGVVDLVAHLGGTLAGEHGDGRLRAPFLERIWGPAAVGAFRALKTSADPGDILNPGVILPRPGQDPLAGLHPRDERWPR